MECKSSIRQAKRGAHVKDCARGRPNSSRLFARASAKKPTHLGYGQGGERGLRACLTLGARTRTRTRALQEDKSSETAQSSNGAQEFNLLPVYEKIFSDHLNPILAYRCITKDDTREAPSFLFESVENGEHQGRYSFVGSKPKMEVLGSGSKVTVMNHVKGTREVLVSLLFHEILKFERK